jgi:hypothetical protein
MKNIYQKFDWDVIRDRNPIKAKYLENYGDSPITEDQFVQDWKQFKPFSKLQMTKGKAGSHNSRKLWRRYSDRELRKQYGKLKNKFGFFLKIQ